MTLQIYTNIVLLMVEWIIILLTSQLETVANRFLLIDVEDGKELSGKTGKYRKNIFFGIIIHRKEYFFIARQNWFYMMYSQNKLTYV